MQDIKTEIVKMSNVTLQSKALEGSRYGDS